MALFGENYGDRVRVVEIGGPFSIELCGGTHVEHSSQIGPVAVLGESSVGSGARRIEAYSGLESFRYFTKEAALASGLAAELKTPSEQLPERIAQLTERLRAAEKEIENLHRQQLLHQTADIAARAERVSEYMLVAEHLPDGISTGDLRTMANDIRGKLAGQLAVIALASATGTAAAYAIAVAEPAVRAGVKAGELVKAFGQYVDGKGGGKPELAQGSGADAAGIGAGLEHIRQTLSGSGNV